MARFEVSQSKVRTWRECRARYHWAYVRKLRPQLKPRALRFGSMIHIALEAISNGQGWAHELKRRARREKIFAEERELERQEIATASIIMREYEDFWKKDKITYTAINRRYSEHEFTVPLTPKIDYNGTVDAVGRYQGIPLLVERKTTSNDVLDASRWHDIQTTLYALYWPHTKVAPIEGVLWDLVRTKEPTRPQITQKGKLSTRELDTLPTAIREVLRENNISEKHPDAALMLANATANRNRWFARKRSTLQDVAVRQIQEEFIETAREMRELVGESRVKTIGRHCDWCDFRRLCETELTGGDVSTVLEREYVRAPDRSSKARRA